MRAKELVPILAEIYGVPFEAAFMIDRSVAECGLREKGRGRSLPEMTRREALIFLVACMTAQKATKAGIEVLPWVEATGYINDEILPGDYPTEDYAALGMECPQELIDTGSLDEPVIHNYHMRQVLTRLGSYENFKLIDFLLALCDMFESNPHVTELFKFEISVSHGWASVTINETFSGGFSEVRFQTEAGGKSPQAYETQINKSVLVYGGAIRALAVRTQAEESIKA